VTNSEAEEIKQMMEEEMARSTLPEIRRAVDDVKGTAISEIKSVKQESTVLSYKMLLVGAIFGFLGSGLVATIIKLWGIFVINSGVIPAKFDVVLYFVFAIAFIICMFLVIIKIGSVNKQKK
jgi:hypothetical protein